MLNGAPRGSARSLRALEWLNAIVADVRAGVGPYLAIYLRASRYWDPEQIGLAMSAMDLASVLGQTPAGGLTDRARDKRLLVVAAAVGVAAGSLLVVHSQHVPPVIAAQAVIGAMAALFPTAIAAIPMRAAARMASTSLKPSFTRPRRFPLGMRMSSKCSAAVGAATAEAARATGWPVSVIPEAYLAEGLVASFRNEPMNGRRILLARALYKNCDLGDEIPAEFFGAVARVLAFVMMMKAKGSAAGLHTGLPSST